ncbi:MAG TPA: hypothetical protein VI298_15360 [Geobacteraceae bacterium]
MRRNTVKSGLNLISGGVVAVILATFFHEQMAGLLFLSPGGETRFVFLGLFWGGILGFCGILVTIIGFLRPPAGERQVRLFAALLTLVVVILIFFILLVGSFRSSELPRLRGETITI